MIFLFVPFSNNCSLEFIIIAGLRSIYQHSFTHGSHWRLVPDSQTKSLKTLGTRLAGYKIAEKSIKRHSCSQSLLFLSAGGVFARGKGGHLVLMSSLQRLRGPGGSGNENAANERFWKDPLRDRFRLLNNEKLPEVKKNNQNSSSFPEPTIFW